MSYLILLLFSRMSSCVWKEYLDVRRIERLEFLLKLNFLLLFAHWDRYLYTFVELSRILLLLKT